MDLSKLTVRELFVLNKQIDWEIFKRLWWILVIFSVVYMGYIAYVIYFKKN